MGCCNSKNRVRDVVDDQVVAGVNELSNKNGRKPSITNQLTTDRFIYVKPKDNNRNSEIDDSKISKWNVVKLENVSNSDFLPNRSEIEALKELSNIGPSDHKRLKPFDESDKSKDETKPADQNKQTNEAEKESKPTVERKNDQDVDYDALYEFLFEPESDEEKANDESKSDKEKVKNNDQPLVKADHKNSNQSLSIEKQIEEIINELISDVSSKTKNAESENSNNNNSNVVIIKDETNHNFDKQINSIQGKNDTDKLENNDLEDNTDYDTKYDFLFELESDEEEENKSVDKVKQNDQSLVRIDPQSSEQIKQQKYIQKPDIEENSDSIKQQQEKNGADLERQVEEWKSLIESLTSNSTLMSYALAKTRTEFKLVKDVGDYLGNCKEAKSVTEKAWIIYIWITHNIEYDVVCLQNKDYRFCKPQSVLERGLAVCAGYAELYKTLCTQLGVVECISIGGYSKGGGYKVGQKVTEESHVWNAIPRMGSDGKLRFIESTWGAGYLDENKTFVKKFEPHYFAVPAHIFNESHHSGSYTPTDGTNKFTKEEFDDCPNNKIGYHILGLSCVNNTMRAITRTNKNPLVIEYTAPQKIYLQAKLLEEETGRELKDDILLQSEYSMTKDQKSRYCLIADIQEKGRNYKLRLYAKNKRRSEEEEESYRMITEFLVVREGEEENIIPRYNLTFDHDLSLTSHFSRYIKFKTNQLVMEFEAPYNNNRRIYFSATLIDEKTGVETKNAALVQSQYSMSNEQKSRYCMIIEVPEKWTKYKLQIFASCDKNVEKFPFLTDFILIREGDEEINIPSYNLTFDYDLRLTSHFSRYINFKTNQLVMEFETLNNSHTPQKTYFRTKLLEEKTGIEIKNGELIQSEYSMSKDQKSKYCMIIEIPEKWTKYRLKLYASNDDKVNTYPFLTDFILIREGDEEINIPRYNLTFDYDLRLTSHFSQYIKFKANPLVIELEAPNNSQTPQKIIIATKLVEEKTGIEIKNPSVVQYEYAIFKDQKSRYCVIADIPEKRKKYKLQLFAKDKLSSEYNKDYFPFLTEFLVTREGDEESYIPQYNLSFDHDIKLKSHYCQFIKFKTNPLVMEFEVPKHIKTLFNVKTMNDSDVEDAVFSQINPENSKTVIQIILPRNKEKFILKVYAKHIIDQGNYGFVSQMFLTRTRSNKNDDLRFCKMKMRGEDYFIYSPIEYYLNSNNLYEFRYYIKDALDVVLIDNSKKRIHLKRVDNEKSIWKLTTFIREKGKITLYAKFNKNNTSYYGICYYQVD